MSFFYELHVFLRNILYWIVAFCVSSISFFLFGFEKVAILGKTYILPQLSTNSISVQIFNKISHDLLPDSVKLMATSPTSAFVSQIWFSLLLGFLLTFPIFIYEFVVYLQPALLPHEKKAVLWSLFPFVSLFLSGAAFSYFILIPSTFRMLYPYATAVGANSFFLIDEFIHYVVGLMLAIGFMFLLPLFIILLSYLGIIKTSFWRNKWRYSFLFFLILSAIITPDGSGVTMLMLFIPLMGLYSAGCFFADRVGRDA